VLLAISASYHKFADSTRASGSNNRLAGESFWEKWLHPTALFWVKRIHGLCYALPGRKGAQRGGTGRKAQAIHLLLQIASRIGTFGGTLSMWLGGKARPPAEELAAIENSLKASLTVPSENPKL